MTNETVMRRFCRPESAVIFSNILQGRSLLRYNRQESTQPLVSPERTVEALMDFDLTQQLEQKQILSQQQI